MTKNVLLCGVGGQGTVLASRLIALAADGKGNGSQRRRTVYAENYLGASECHADVRLQNIKRYHKRSYR